MFAAILALLAAPLDHGDAQEHKAQQNKLARIAFLSQGTSPILLHVLKSFRERMAELGSFEGQNVAIDYRFAEGRVDRLPDLVAELIGLRSDLIIPLGQPRSRPPNRQRQWSPSSQSTWKAVNPLRERLGRRVPQPEDRSVQIYSTAA